MLDSNFTNNTFLLAADYFYLLNNTFLLDTHNTTSSASANDTVSTSDIDIYAGVTSHNSVELWEPYDWNGSQYPSGYSQVRIIVTAFFVTFIMVVIVVGNMLVCIAIATEKALKTVQNWFIASLAVSDFLVGLVIMPFSLAKELMGYWIFGNLWCEIHAALDVLLCTASINNLCLISLDRYWSVTQAVKYLKKRTPTRAVMMIFFVWLLSALISLPPLLGWKKEEKKEVYPSCSLSDDVGYVLYSAFGSFYIPAIVMVFVYIRIFLAARNRARRHVKKPRHATEVTNDPHRDKSTTTTTCTSFSNPSPPDKRREDVYRFQDQPKLNGGKRESPLTPTLSNMPQIIIEATHEMSLQSLPSPTLFPSDISCRHQAEGIPEETLEEQEREDDYDDDDYRRMESAAEYEKNTNRDVAEQKEGQLLSVGNVTESSANVMPTKVTVSIVSDIRPHSSRPYVQLHHPIRHSQTKSLAPRRVRTTFEPITHSDSITSCSIQGYDQEVSDLYKAHTPSSSTIKKRGKLRGRLPLRPHGPLITTPSDAERQKRRLAKARERRATLILGLIMAAFILAWLPFFVLYVLEALCSTCNIGQTGFATAFWLGYCNSALNPIIYTIFNRDFRRAFKKILLK